MSRVLALTVVSLVGCGTWTELGVDTKTLPPTRGAREVREPRLAVTGALRIEAREIAIDVAAKATCRTALRNRTEKAVRQKYKLKQSPGWILLGLGALGAVTTGFILTLGEDADTGVGFIGAGGAIWGSQVYFASRDTKVRTKKSVIPGDNSFEDNPCDDKAVSLPARVALATPWGQKLEGAVDNGKARFTVAWEKIGFDKLTSYSSARTKLGTKWVVSAPGFADLEVRPEAAVVEQMIGAASQAIGFSIACPSDGATRLAIQPPGNQTIRAGERNEISVVVQNQGPGTSCDGTLDLVFDDPALPAKLSVPMGRIVPSERATVKVVLDPPRNAAGKQGIVMLATAGDSKRTRSPEIVTTIDLIAADRPRLGVKCTFISGTVAGDQGRVLVNAGDSVGVACNVTNNGTGLAPKITVAFELKRTVDGKNFEDPSVAVTRYTRQGSAGIGDLAPGKSGDARTTLPIPADAHKLDKFEVSARATDGTFGLSGTSAALELDIGLVDPCRGRKLVQAEYERERKAIQDTYKDPKVREALLKRLFQCRKT